MRKLEELNNSYFGPRVSDGAGVFIAGFVFYFIFQIVLLIVAQLAKIDLNNMPLWFNWILTIFNQIALVVAVVAYGGIARKPLLKESRINRRLNYKQLLLIPVITIVCIMAFLPLAEGFVKLVSLITKKPVSGSVTIGTQWWEILISTILLSVLPAIGEELLFRAGVARSLKRQNYLFGILMSAILFSLFHGNAAQTVHQFFIGAVFAYLYFVTGSLLASSLCHFFNNAFAILFDLAIAGLKIEPSFGTKIAVYVVMSIVGFVALYFLLRLMMKISKQAKGIENNTDKMAWAKDIGKAFTAKGIKDNYQRFNNSLKMLFDDPCDCINLNGDLEDYSQQNKIAPVAEGNVEKAYDEPTSQIVVDQNAVDSKFETQTTSEETAVANQYSAPISGVDNKRASDVDDEMSKLLREANLQTIKKRKRFDRTALILALCLVLGVWIINLIISILQ